MVARRRASKKKKTASVKLDAATLKKLSAAHASLSDLAEAIEMAAGNPALVRKRKPGRKRGAKRRARRATKKSSR
jgi:hypothetical protein